MFVTEGESLRTQVGGSYRVFCTAGNFTKCRILNRFSGNKCHIMGTCIMIRVMKTVGIDKMCIRTAKCLRTLIHQVAESTDGAADKLGGTIADFIGR